MDVIGLLVSFILAQDSAAPARTSDPTSNPWLQFGILGLIIVGILYLKVIVPGWIYQAEVARVIRLEEQVVAKDAEIARLRDLAENRTIPLLERALVLVERVEGSWDEPQHQQFSGVRRRGQPHGQE